MYLRRLTKKKNNNKDFAVIKIWGKNYEIGLLNSDIRYGSIVVSNSESKNSLSEEVPSKLNQKDSLTSKVYAHMRTGAKMRQMQISKRLRKISLDRESIFNKLMNNHDNIIVQKTIEEEEIEDYESKKHTEQDN